MLLPNFLKAQLPSKNYMGRKLIVVQLSGGNDGLNTLIPTRNDLYYKLRPNLGINRSRTLTIDSEHGIHPVLKNFASLLEKGELSVVNQVGYPNPNRSHFRSMDIWHTASSADEYHNIGWLGTHLDSNCKNIHNAIQIGSKLDLALQGERLSGMALEDPKTAYRVMNEPFFKDLESQSTDKSELDYLYKTLMDTRHSAEYVYRQSDKVSKRNIYPNTLIGKRMQTVGALINSGLDTSVYYVDHSGFDTHVQQINKQERLLRELDEGIGALVKDLRQTGEWKNTLIMVFSEFGRRVAENGSRGTDHGTANNLWLLGGQLKSNGLYNPLSDLSDLHNGDLKYQVDFRSVYSSILKDWMRVPKHPLLNKGFDCLDIF